MNNADALTHGTVLMMTPPELIPAIFLIVYWFGPDMISKTGAVVWMMFIISEFTMLCVCWSSLSILQIQASMLVTFVVFVYGLWAERSAAQAKADVAREQAEVARKQADVAREQAELAKKTAETAAARVKADADSKEHAFKAREKDMLAELRAKEDEIKELVSRLPAADAAGPQT
jgi:hypothetical protein